jgi:hypothetical protein
MPLDTPIANDRFDRSRRAAEASIENGAEADMRNGLRSWEEGG